MLPSIGVPTTAGTGSEAQSYALIADEQDAPEDGLRRPQGRLPRRHPRPGSDGLAAAARDGGHRHRRPVARPRILRHHQAQSRCRRCSPARPGELLEANLETVLRQPGDLEARGAMQLGAYLAGMAIENSMLGACHACANPLTAHYGLTHGIAIGILLPHVIRFNAAAVGSLYADLAEMPAWSTAIRAAEVLARRVGAIDADRRAADDAVGVRRQRGNPAGAGRGSGPAMDRPLQPPACDRQGSAGTLRGGTVAKI